jgi:hypothetical protein
MKLREILTVPGVAGLFKLVASNKNNIIIESLNDGKRQSLAINHKVSSLGDIAIFTKEEDLPLADVFKKMHEAEGKATADSKAAPDAMKKYFNTIIPDIDEEKVHHSHMKKILTWYEILKSKEVDFNNLGGEGDDEDKTLPEGSEKAHGTPKVQQTHAPKADQHSKVAPVKLRKKV